MPTLMPTRATPGGTRRTYGLSEMTRVAYLLPFADVAILGEPYNSKLVMRLGQRFESARRLTFFPARPLKRRSPRESCRGLCQQYVSSRVSQSLIPCIGELQAVAA